MPSPKSFFLLALISAFFIPSIASAHQPRITTQAVTVVTDPEISKAYYAQLSGAPQTYTIRATAPFDLYVNLLVPDIAGQQKDVSAVILKNGDARNPVATLAGPGFAWTRFFEPFGHDTYWMGPEYKARVDAGEYEVRVSSPKNDSRYSLAIGEIEAFDAKETVNTISLIPQIKKNFFSKSPADFILSPIGAGYAIIMFAAAFLAGFVYRLILKRVATKLPRRASKNIGAPDRLVRAALGIGLFLLAIMTFWSAILLFAAGFCLFEAIFSWCGLYAALGKNTCPMS